MFLFEPAKWFRNALLGTRNLSGICAVQCSVLRLALMSSVTSTPYFLRWWKPGQFIKFSDFHLEVSSVCSGVLSCIYYPWLLPPCTADEGGAAAAIGPLLSDRYSRLNRAYPLNSCIFSLVNTCWYQASFRYCRCIREAVHSYCCLMYKCITLTRAGWALQRLRRLLLLLLLLYAIQHCLPAVRLPAFTVTFPTSVRR